MRQSGITPNEEKIKVVNDMVAPQNKKGLQTYLGLVNYLRKFSLKLTAPICQLIKFDVQWV